MKVYCPTCDGHGTVEQRFSFPTRTETVNRGLFTRPALHIVNEITGERVGVAAATTQSRYSEYDVLPRVTCETCAGSGWITEEDAKLILEIRQGVKPFGH